MSNIKAESVKAKLQGLLSSANTKTGKNDPTLTDAVNTLVEGYGQGGAPVLQEKTATENGEVTADEGYDGLSKVIVNVEGGGGSYLPPEIATEAEMTALLETAELGSVYKYTGETTDLYENGALYVVEESE